MRTSLLAIAAAAAMHVSASAVEQQSTVIDDFESGALNGWETKVSLRGTWTVYSDGQAAPDSTKSDSKIPFNVPSPPQGRYAAVTDTNGPGLRILYRDLKLDGAYLLRLTVFYTSAGPLISPDTLDYSVGPNQQYRVDLLAPSAPVDSVAKDDVLATVFHTAPGDPTRGEPRAITVDLSPWQGRAVRLRFASVDNRGPLRAGVDDIRLEPVAR
jgi:hypothetical protein